jgi:hypothetical protein
MSQCPRWVPDPEAGSAGFATAVLSKQQQLAHESIRLTGPGKALACAVPVARPSDGWSSSSCCS